VQHGVEQDRVLLGRVEGLKIGWVDEDIAPIGCGSGMFCAGANASEERQRGEEGRAHTQPQERGAHQAFGCRIEFHTLVLLVVGASQRAIYRLPQIQQI
jgi:hypothetical protein